MEIPFIDLKSQYKFIEEPVREAINQIFNHGNYIMGPEVEKLEEALKIFTDTKHCLTCSSGTDALLLPLMAYGVGPGDAVFTSPFTFIATAEVITLLGATPVFVDIDPLTYNIDPALLKEKIFALKADTDLRPSGIIPVDLFGLPADYDPIMEIAVENDLFVIEDAAQSFGASYKGRRSGCLAHVSATSFYPAKPLGCYGDGGAVFTNDDSMANALFSLRNHGQGLTRYDHERIGLNARLDSIQAAILLLKLTIFEGELKKRQKAAHKYSQRLESHVQVPHIPEGSTSSWAQYSILVDHRDEIRNLLQTAGIPTAIYYEKPLHMQNALKSKYWGDNTYPVSEKVANKIISLPFHPYLTDSQIDYISDRLLCFASDGIGQIPLIG